MFEARPLARLPHKTGFSRLDGLVPRAELDRSSSEPERQATPGRPPALGGGLGNPAVVASPAVFTSRQDASIGGTTDTPAAVDPITMTPDDRRRTETLLKLRNLFALKLAVGRKSPSSEHMPLQPRQMSKRFAS